MKLTSRVVIAGIIAVIGVTLVVVYLNAFTAPDPIPAPQNNTPAVLRPDKPLAVSSDITLAFVGDVLMVYGNSHFASMSSSLRPADIAFCNLESPISSRGTPTPLKYRNGRVMYNEYMFRANPRAAQTLVNGGIDVVSLANNHSTDYGPVALQDTVTLLGRAGIAHAGAGLNLADARRPSSVTRKSVRVAYLCYVLGDTLPDKGADFAASDKPGVALLDLTDRDAVLRTIREDIESARRSSNLVVVSYHWGVERSLHPTTEQIWLAHRTIDSGADIIVGHHSHTLQGMEIYKGGLIMYSMGNFIFPTRSALISRTGVALVKFKNGGCTVTFRPAYIYGISPVPKRRPEVQAAASQMHYGCRALKTPAAITWVNGEPLVTFSIKEAKAYSDRADFIDVREVIPGIDVDLRYAGLNNRYKTRFYKSTRCFLRRGTAERLALVEKDLRARGFGLKIWDGYRPLSVQYLMWTKVRNSRYLASPAVGSKHNRGAAVDVTLVGRNGKELPMPTQYDDFSPLASGRSPSTSFERRRNAEILRNVMKAHGFRPISSEWWHFEDADAAGYPCADICSGDLDSCIPKPTK